MKLTTRGFTLVELMIVIAIIGILAAALFPSMTAYMKRSRDAARASNLKDISTAVGAFYSDMEYYPAGTASGCANGTAIDNKNYFPKDIPQDPTSGTAQSPCGYAFGGKGNYGYGSSSATSATGFIVSAKMENINGGNWTGAVANIIGNGVAVSTRQAEILKGTGAYYLLTN